MNVSTMQPQYRTVTAAGFAGAIMTIAAWGLHHFGITVPQEVMDATTFLITSGAAWIVHPRSASEVQATSAVVPPAAAPVAVPAAAPAVAKPIVAPAAPTAAAAPLGPVA